MTMSCSFLNPPFIRSPSPACEAAPHPPCALENLELLGAQLLVREVGRMPRGVTGSSMDTGTVHRPCMETRFLCVWMLLSVWVRRRTNVRECVQAYVQAYVQACVQVRVQAPMRKWVTAVSS